MLASAALVALAVIWGYNWVVIKVGVRDASPFVFAACRTFGGGILLAIVTLCLRRPMRPQYPLQTFLIGFFQTACFVGLATWAVVSAGAGQVAMLAYTMPLWVSLIAWPVLGERIGVPQVIALLIAFAGVACMIGRLHVNVLSDTLAVLAGITWAIGIVMTKRLQRKDRVDLFGLTMWQMLFGGAVLVAVALIAPSHATVWTPSYTFAVVYNIVIARALGYSLWIFALDVLPARDASMWTLPNPIIGALGAWLVLGEVPNRASLIGMGLIVLGLIVLTVADRAKAA